MSAISKIDGKLLADLTARARIKNILKEIEDIKNSHDEDIVERVEELSNKLKTLSENVYTTADIDDAINDINDSITRLANNTYSSLFIDNKLTELYDGLLKIINERYSNKIIDTKLENLRKDFNSTNNIVKKEVNDKINELKLLIEDCISEDEVAIKINTLAKNINDNLQSHYYTNSQIDNKIDDIRNDLTAIDIKLLVTLVGDDTNEIVDDGYELPLNNKGGE